MKNNPLFDTNRIQDKISIEIDNKNNPLYFVADLVELLSLLSNEGYYTLASFGDSLSDGQIDDEVGGFTEQEKKESEIAPDDVSPYRSNSSLQADEREDSARVIFERLQIRAQWFEDFYPFTFETPRKLQAPPSIEALPLRQKLYIVLLISSLFQVATKSGIYALGHKFEALCEPFFKELIPPQAMYALFGAGGKAQAKSYSGTFLNKIQNLANDLYLYPQRGIEQDLHKNNVGDGGLDWVGYFDFKDAQSRAPLYFAQCACGDNWQGNKQFDCHIDKWQNYIDFKVYPTVLHFIPKCYRENNKRFYEEINITRNISVIDRLRFCFLAKNINEQELEKLLKDNYDDVLKELSGIKLDFHDV